MKETACLARLCKVAAAGVMCVVLCAAAWGQNAANPYDLWSQATLYRDGWGTPHVYGDNPRAMAFAFGYAQAEDHLEGMLLAYRVANGRAAEVLGEAYAESDAFSIRMNHAGLAQEAFANADPVTRDLCEGFAIGVNTWLAEHAHKAPEWAEGVRPPDILALLHAFLMSMAPFDLEDAYRRAPGLPSANAWAVGPTRSETGEAMLAINPHADYTGPFQWYEAHLVTQDMNIAGATLFGLPVILQGHNEVLGWALAPNEPDFADMYIEPGMHVARDPASLMPGPAIEPERYQQLRLMANARPMYVRTGAGLRRQYVERLDTPRGPFIGRHRGRQVAYKVGGYRDFGGLRQLVEMARARNLGEFQDALALHQLPCFHIVYADRMGNIFYLYNTKVGTKFMRAPQHVVQAGDQQNQDNRNPELVNWHAPVSGGDSRYAWGPIVPVSALPSVTNPDSGFIQASGSPPWRVTDRSGIDPADWPYWLVRDQDSYRAQRARSLLNRGGRSFQDMQSMLYDILTPFALDAVPHVLQAAEQRSDLVASLHPDLPGGLDLLRNWNYVADPRSTGMTFFHEWWEAVQQMAPPSVRSEHQLYAAIREDVPEMRELSLRAAAEAAKNLRNRYQALSVPWGEVNRIHRGDREAPLAGAYAGEPIFLSKSRDHANGKRSATFGYGFAMAVQFGDRPRAVSMLPFGVSQNPDSPHYADQVDLMAERRFKVTRFHHDDVQRAAQSAFGRQLALRPRGKEAQVTVRSAIPQEGRLITHQEAPAPLPDGHVAFTLFTEVELARPDAPVSVDLDVFIPESICRAEHLPYLQVWAFDEYSGGWRPVESQENAHAVRTLSARDNAPRTYAVLGPTDFLEVFDGDLDTAPRIIPRPPEPDRLEFPDTDWDDDVELPAPPDRDGLPEELLIAARDGEAPDPDAPARMDMEFTGPPSETPEPAETPEDPDAPGRMHIEFTEPPEVPEATEAEEPGDPDGTGRMRIEFTEPPEGLARTPDEDLDAPSPLALARPDALQDRLTPDALQPEPAQEPAAPAPEPQETPDVAEDEAPEVHYEPPDGEAPTGRTRMAMEFTGPQGEAARPEPQQEQEQTRGVERGYKATGPVAWGRAMQVRGPDMEAQFHVEARTAIRARVAILQSPPAPPPSGKAAFTEYIALEQSPEGVPLEASVIVRVPEGKRELAATGELALYYYDPNRGWRTVQGQRFNEETNNFSAIGGRAGVYAVFGPREHRN